MRIGNLEIEVFREEKVARVVKHYNSAVSKEIRLTEDDIYALEFAVKEIKRNLNLK